MAHLASSLTIGMDANFCRDISGQDVPSGLLVVPGPDPCLACTCIDGEPRLCKTLLCAPPVDCPAGSLRLHDDQCCRFTCLPGPGVSEERGRDVVRARLVATGLMLVLSVALLVFLVHRLRKRRRQTRRREAEEEAEDEEEDEIADLAFVEASRGGRGANRGVWSSWAFWKSPPDLFEMRPPPPSYDDAMRNSQPATDVNNVGNDNNVINDNNVGNDRNVSNDVFDSHVFNPEPHSEAPPYDQIFADAVVESGPARIPATAARVLPPVAGRRRRGHSCGRRFESYASGFPPGRSSSWSRRPSSGSQNRHRRRVSSHGERPRADLTQSTFHTNPQSNNGIASNNDNNVAASSNNDSVASPSNNDVVSSNLEGNDVDKVEEMALNEVEEAGLKTQNEASNGEIEISESNLNKATNIREEIRPHFRTYV